MPSIERSVIDEKDKNGEQMGSRNARMAWYDPVNPWMWLKATSMGPPDHTTSMADPFCYHSYDLEGVDDPKSSKMKIPSWWVERYVKADRG
jgi:hypothetical protein